MKTVFTLLLFFITNNWEIDYTYSNICEYLVGIVLLTIITEILDAIIFSIAFKRAGWFKKVFDLNKEETSRIHWTIRIALAVIITLLLRWNVIENVFSWCVVQISNYIISQYNTWSNDFINNFEIWADSLMEKYLQN